MDLSAASAPGTGKNLWFVQVSRALRAKGFAVVRYDKRSFAAAERLKADPGFKDTPGFRAYEKNPLKHFVEDVRHMARWTRERLPTAEVHILGISQGTYLALQAAHQDSAIAGLALVGFMAGNLDQALISQFVYRSRITFARLDVDRDGRVAAPEMNVEDPVAQALKAQLSILDLDGDQAVSASEFDAGNFSNIAMDPASIAEYRLQEAKYPRPAEILKELAIPVLFLHGEWDNQTPAYQTRAIEMLNRVAWKKPNLNFRYFPKLGHALDPRDSYEDIVYRRIAPEALEALGEGLNGAFPDRTSRRPPSHGAPD